MKSDKLTHGETSTSKYSCVFDAKKKISKTEK